MKSVSTAFTYFAAVIFLQNYSLRRYGYGLFNNPVWPTPLTEFSLINDIWESSGLGIAVNERKKQLATVS
jgi:hypothetical protein